MNEPTRCLTCGSELQRLYGDEDDGPTWVPLETGRDWASAYVLLPYEAACLDENCAFRWHEDLPVAALGLLQKRMQNLAPVDSCSYKLYLVEKRGKWDVEVHLWRPCSEGLCKPVLDAMVEEGLREAKKLDFGLTQEVKLLRSLLRVSDLVKMEAPSIFLDNEIDLIRKTLWRITGVNGFLEPLSKVEMDAEAR